MRKLSISYLEKALRLAEKDLEELSTEMNYYLHVDTGNREEIDRYLKMHRAGYDLCKETERQVDIEMAIADLKILLFWEKRKLK